MSDDKLVTPNHLAAVISISELSGWLNKSLVVPPNRLGVLYSSDGQFQTLQPGQHEIRSIGDRLLKGKNTTICGLIPDDRFSIRITAPYLTSRDGFLVDMEMVCRVKINQGDRFFRKEVIPLGKILDEPHELDEGEARKAFNPLAAQHDWLDLVRGYSIDRLIELMFPILPRFLQDRGMELVSVDVILFNQSNQRPETIEKTQRIKQEVRKIKQEDSPETKQNLFSKLRELLPEGFHFRKEQDDEVLEQIMKLSPDDGRKESSKHRGLWENSFGIVRDEKAVQYKWLPKFWWARRTLWIVSLLAVGALITYLTLHFAAEADGSVLWSFILIGVWGVIIPLVLDSLKKLIEKREKLAEIRWLAPGSIYLYDLVHKDREGADTLVRKHCGEELEKTISVLHDLRSRVFKTGDSETAMQLRTLERKIGDAVEQVQSSKFGPAAYLNDLNIPNQAWHKMLDYDEDLMLYANALFDEAALAQLVYPDKDLDGSKLNELERHLDLFMAKFAARSRVVKA
jgi:hypothetical protein